MTRTKSTCRHTLYSNVEITTIPQFSNWALSMFCLYIISKLSHTLSTQHKFKQGGDRIYYRKFWYFIKRVVFDFIIYQSLVLTWERGRLIKVDIREKWSLYTNVLLLVVLYDLCVLSDYLQTNKGFEILSNPRLISYHECKSLCKHLPQFYLLHSHADIYLCLNIGN